MVFWYYLIVHTQDGQMNESSDSRLNLDRGNGSLDNVTFLCFTFGVLIYILKYMLK